MIVYVLVWSDCGAVFKVVSSKEKADAYCKENVALECYEREIE